MVQEMFEAVKAMPMVVVTAVDMAVGMAAEAKTEAAMVEAMAKQWRRR
jgi:hypothetical protein